MVGVIALLGVSCLRPTQAVMEDTSPLGWADTVVLAVENGDTTTLRDLSLVVRSNREFRCDSLPLEITLLTPDFRYYSEQITFPIRHERSAAALRRVNEIPYRRRVILNRIGTYRLILFPSIPVEGIEAVGINIVKSEPTE